MMGLGRADIESMSLWEYEARLWHWNDAHGGHDDIQAPEPGITQAILDKANADPRLTQGPNVKKRKPFPIPAR